jgi:hypothetical protein
MDSAREDVPRVAIDELDAWRDVKASCLSAAHARLDEELAAGGTTEHRELLLQHLNQVRFPAKYSTDTLACS